MAGRAQAVSAPHRTNVRPSGVPVLLVGAGPVGLALGCMLAQRGVPFCLLERRTAPHRHSRSIGIHPPALEVLDTIGVAEEMIARGVRIGGGRAFSGRRPLGRIAFDRLPARYRFVLTLPQHRTEAILERRLEVLAPGAIERGVVVGRVTQHDEGVVVSALRHGESAQWRAAVVVGCDGARGSVRPALGIGSEGGPYPDRYLMGDFADSTSLGSDAGIFLTREGVVESFPLPGGVRRWVARTTERVATQDARHLAVLVERRTGVPLDPDTNTMLSAFGVERRFAQRFARGRAALAGDAAHLISPIGGQGMNLGWLDAAALSAALTGIVRQGRDAAATLERYGIERRRAARRAAFRSESNMRLGRPARFAAGRDALLWLLLRPPLDRYAARFFTMLPLLGTRDAPPLGDRGGR